MRAAAVGRWSKERERERGQVYKFMYLYTCTQYTNCVYRLLLPISLLICLVQGVREGREQLRKRADLRPVLYGSNKNQKEGKQCVPPPLLTPTRPFPMLYTLHKEVDTHTHTVYVCVCVYTSHTVK